MTREQLIPLRAVQNPTLTIDNGSRTPGVISAQRIIDVGDQFLFFTPRNAPLDGNNIRMVPTKDVIRVEYTEKVVVERKVEP